MNLLRYPSVAHVAIAGWFAFANLAIGLQGDFVHEFGHPFIGGTALIARADSGAIADFEVIDNSGRQIILPIRTSALPIGTSTAASLGFRGTPWLTIDLARYSASGTAFTASSDELAGLVFNEGFSPLCLVGAKELWGYIDIRGVVRIEPTYDMGMRFSEGLAAVMIADRWGFIDKYGKLRVAIEYDLVDRFSEGLALVAKKVGKSWEWGFIDSYGNRLIWRKQSGGAGTALKVKSTDAK